MKRTVLFAAAVATLAAAVLTSAADAQRRRGDGLGRSGERPQTETPPDESEGGPGPDIVGAFSPVRANREDMEKRGFVSTGLEAIYPADADCLPIVSPFASRTRHDGSDRSTRFFEGLHGGADISAPGGTPLLAIADGTVVHMHEGANIGGIGLFLQHSPEDTGLPVWLYTEYKHLREMPPLRIGQRVKMGERIALVGNTGTTGGRAYGAAGYYHLHWTAFYSETAEYKTLRMFIPVGGQWLDPLAVFLREPLNSQSIGKLPPERRKVRIAYMRSDGRIVPADAKIIWPIACRARYSNSQ